MAFLAAAFGLAFLIIAVPFLCFARDDIRRGFPSVSAFRESKGVHFLIFLLLIQKCNPNQYCNAVK